MTRTNITHLDSLPPDAAHLFDADGPARVYANLKGGVAVFKRLGGAGFGPQMTVEEALSAAGATPLWGLDAEMDDGTATTLPNRWHKKWDQIFRYFFRYPSDQRDLVHAFCAAVRDDWSSTVAYDGVPSEWIEDQADSGAYLLEFDATLAHAIQYGREQPIAERVTDFDKVEFAKTLSPDVDWDGMELTDSRGDTKSPFAPGDLHLTDDTDLQGQIHTQVTRSDLIDHWELEYSG